MARIPQKITCFVCKGEGRVKTETTIWIRSDRGIIDEDDVYGFHLVPASTESVTEVTKLVWRTCSQCTGKGWTGSKDYPVQCSKCNGEGAMTEEVKEKEKRKISWFSKKCPKCNGVGSLIEMVKE